MKKLRFCLLFATFFISAAKAQTLEGYQNERDELNAKVQGNARRRTEGQNQLNSLADQRRSVLQQVHIRLDESAKKKNKDHQLSLIELRTEGDFVYRIMRAHLRKNQILIEQYKSIVQEFAEYLAEGKAHETQIQNAFKSIKLAKTYSDLAIPAFKLDQIFVRERSAHSNLTTQLSSVIFRFRNKNENLTRKLVKHKSIIQKYNFPVDFDVSDSLVKAEKMFNYIESRWAKLQSHLNDGLQAIQLKNQSIFDQAMDTWNAEHQRKKLEREHYGREFDRFIAEVKSLLNSIKTLTVQRDHENTKSQIKPIMPEYEAFRKILGYQDFCSQVSAKTTESSPYYTGCGLLKYEFRTAELYNKDVAWLAISCSLFHMAHAPSALSPRIEKLKNFEKLNEMGEPHLYEAILLHDSIVQDWNLAPSTEN